VPSPGTGHQHFIIHDLFSSFSIGNPMDKELRVRLEFERTGQLDALRRLRQHNQKQRVHEALPQHAEDMPAMEAVLAPNPYAHGAFRNLSKNEDKRYFLRVVRALLACGQGKTVAHPNMGALIALICPEKHLTVQTPEEFVPRGVSPERVAKQLMHHLFGQHTLPRWLWKGLWQHGHEELLYSAIYAMQGKSLRELPGTRPALSKRMVHHFLRAPEGSCYQKGYRWAQVRRWGGTMRHFVSLRDSLIWVDDDEKEFWELLIKYLMSLPPLPAKEVNLLHQHLRYQRFGRHHNSDWSDCLPSQPENPHYKYQHLPMEKLLEQARQHQADCEALYRARLNGWPMRLPNLAFGYISVDRRVRWEAVELTSQQQLILESRRMNHCVKTYVNYCLQGTSAIFSIRRNGKSVATIDLNPGTMKVDQVQGPCNTALEGDVLEAYEVWRSCVGLQS
jgi:PcfJ-like protein